MSYKGDLISRRDAIGAIEKAKMAQTPDGEIYVAKYNAEMNIQLLPSVQPEPDCSLKEFGDCSYSETGCSDCKIKNRIRTALNVAQPEIIRCKNCKYWVVEEDEAYCYLIVMVHGAKDGSGFCSDAKRAD